MSLQIASSPKRADLGDLVTAQKLSAKGLRMGSPKDRQELDAEMRPGRICERR
jgi:hypothetical protein